MRILIIGSGGREHTLAWKIAQSPRVEKVFVSPGNDGLADVAEPVAIKAGGIEDLADWAEKNRIDFTVVGPEVPLALGIADVFARRGLPLFGPSRAAARLEASKVFAKELMAKYGIPTAPFRVFDKAEAAKEYIRSRQEPPALKRTAGRRERSPPATRGGSRSGNPPIDGGEDLRGCREPGGA